MALPTIQPRQQAPQPPQLPDPSLSRPYYDAAVRRRQESDQMATRVDDTGTHRCVWWPPEC